VLRWVNSQLDRIKSWVTRAAQQEVLIVVSRCQTSLCIPISLTVSITCCFVQQAWDPISPQQRHGGSIVEVYRIIEEVKYMNKKMN
jgi:hypothetical protein